MLLRNSPALTPAMLASHRHSAQISTGARTWRGNAGSRLNPLQESRPSREYVNFLTAPMNAPWTHVSLAVKSLFHTLAGRYLLCLQPVILVSRNGTSHRDESRTLRFFWAIERNKYFYDE